MANRRERPHNKAQQSMRNRENNSIRAAHGLGHFDKGWCSQWASLFGCCGNFHCCSSKRVGSVTAANAADMAVKGVGVDAACCGHRTQLAIVLCVASILERGELLLLAHRVIVVFHNQARRIAWIAAFSTQDHILV